MSLTAFNPVTWLVTGRCLSFTVVADMRPAGLVFVSVSVALLNAEVEVLPLTETFSVRWVKVNGSFGLDCVAVRTVVICEIRPLGKRTLTVAATGACIPDLGSGPSSTVVSVPSGAVVVSSPLVLRSLVCTVPSGYAKDKT